MSILTEDEDVIVGVMPDNPDERDYQYVKQQPTSRLPRRVSLVKYVGEIENQLTTGSCVANASVSALELMTARRGISSDLSRLFVYWNVREPYSYLKGKDKGAYLRDGFKSINKYGVPEEKYWDFNISNVNVKPPKEAYDKAKNNKVLEYRRINKRDIKGIKDALASGFPVIISTAIGKQFLTLSGDIKRQKYGPVNSWSNKLVGYHALTIVGYDDSLRSFIIENSWGDHWGDSGLGRYPYINMARDGIDVWVCTKFEYNKEKVDPVEPDDPVDPDNDNDNDKDNDNDEPNTNKFTNTEFNILKKITKLYTLLSNFFKNN